MQLVTGLRVGVLPVHLTVASCGPLRRGGERWTCDTCGRPGGRRAAGVVMMLCHSVFTSFRAGRCGCATTLPVSAATDAVGVRSSGRGAGRVGCAWAATTTTGPPLDGLSGWVTCRRGRAARGAGRPTMARPRRRATAAAGFALVGWTDDAEGHQAPPVRPSARPLSPVADVPAVGRPRQPILLAARRQEVKAAATATAAA